MNNYDTVLVERLRAMAETCCAGGCDACEAEAKAADRIETLQAIEEAQNENVASLLDRIEALTAVNQELRSENARLREALSAYTEYCPICHGRGTFLEEDSVTGADLWRDCPGCLPARAALRDGA